MPSEQCPVPRFSHFPMPRKKKHRFHRDLGRDPYIFIGIPPFFFGTSEMFGFLTIIVLVVS